MKNRHTLPTKAQFLWPHSIYSNRRLRPKTKTLSYIFLRSRFISFPLNFNFSFAWTQPFYTEIIFLSFSIGNNFMSTLTSDWWPDPANICWSSRRFEDVFKTCLDDVFSVTIFCLPRSLEVISQDVLKTSSRRLGRRNIVTFKTSWRRLEDMSWKRLGDKQNVY